MQLIWFRQDLRIHDHVALWHATQSNQCIALVILSPEQWQLHDDAAIKIDLYLRQLQQLQLQLAQLNIPLITLNIAFWQEITLPILTLCQALNIRHLHANIEFGYNERQRDQQLQNALQKANIECHFYHDRTIFPTGALLNKSGQAYQVFGAFKKACYESLSMSLPQCYPEISAQQPIQLQSQFMTKIPSFTDLYPHQSLSSDISTFWQVGEQHAWQMLDQFIEDKVEHYAKERDFPHLNATSQLAAYLNIGVISIRQCLQRLFQAQFGYFHLENQGQQIWLDELLWREFYQHILWHFPRVSQHQPFKLPTKQMQWRNAPKDLIAWQQGQTGIPIVDAGMRQLLATGWMHNRVRMICAMFLSKNLLIDWRLGEAWFMQHLIDGDLAANNGGWQWCASTGTDAVPYFRIFNPVTQSQKFDAEGDYLRQWLPELAHLDAKTIHEPYAKNPPQDLNYPKPIVDLKSSRIRVIEAFKNLVEIQL